MQYVFFLYSVSHCQFCNLQPREPYLVSISVPILHIRKLRLGQNKNCVVYYLATDRTNSGTKVHLTKIHAINH